MEKCMETYSDTFSSPDLKPLSELRLTVHLKSGGRISQKLYLKNIGKHVIWLHFQTLQMLLNISSCLVKSHHCTACQTSCSFPFFQYRNVKVLNSACPKLLSLLSSLCVLSLQLNQWVLRCLTSPSKKSLTRLRFGFRSRTKRTTWKWRTRNSSFRSRQLGKSWYSDLKSIAQKCNLTFYFKTFRFSL